MPIKTRYHLAFALAFPASFAVEFPMAFPVRVLRLFALGFPCPDSASYTGRP